MLFQPKVSKMVPQLTEPRKQSVICIGSWGNKDWLAKGRWCFSSNIYWLGRLVVRIFHPFVLFHLIPFKCSFNCQIIGFGRVWNEPLTKNSARVKNKEEAVAWVLAYPNSDFFDQAELDRAILGRVDENGECVSGGMRSRVRCIEMFFYTFGLTLSKNGYRDRGPFTWDRVSRLPSGMWRARSRDRALRWQRGHFRGGRDWGAGRFGLGNSPFYRTMRLKWAPNWAYCL